MLKKNLIPLILIVLSLAMLIGNTEGRIRKAGWLGNTVFFPFLRSLRAVETSRQLKQEVFRCARNWPKQPLTS
jgi:rod shape-determining protein MreC